MRRKAIIMNNWQLASIDTLGNGKAKDMLNFAIQEAVDNCLDINRDYKKARKVMLEITLAPAEDRTGIGVTFQAKTRLVPDKAGAEHFVIANTDEGAKAYVNNAQQMDITDAIASGAVAGYNAKTGEVTE